MSLIFSNAPKYRIFGKRSQENTTSVLKKLQMKQYPEEPKECCQSYAQVKYKLGVRAHAWGPSFSGA